MNGLPNRPRLCSEALCFWGALLCWGALLTAAVSARAEPASPPPAAPAGAAGQPPISSPRLAALAHELDAGNAAALDAFWQEIKGRAPLVEPIPGDARHRAVTFVWRGDPQTKGVTLCGGLPTPTLAKPLTRLGQSDLWFLSETHPAEARFEYFFGVNLPQTLPINEMEQMSVIQRYPPLPDPLNPRESDGRSYVELPDAPPQPWIIRRPGVPQGRQSQVPFESRILNAQYPLTIYTPPGYAGKSARCWLMIAFDGGFPMMSETLDNLRAAGRLPPMVVVGVNNPSQESRDHDLSGSEPFARFLADELVPWARKHYRVYGDAAHTLVGGTSLGGLAAVYCGLTHSAVFGKVLAQSPTLVLAPGQAGPSPVWAEEPPGSVMRRFVASARLPVAFYLEAGRYETYFSFSLLGETRRLRDVLEAKGYRVTYHENVGGHNAVCWRGSLADALIALTSPQQR